MSELHFPWLFVIITLPIIGAIIVSRIVSAVQQQRVSNFFFGVIFALSLGTWQDFLFLHAKDAHDKWDLFSKITGSTQLLVDEFNAPMIPLICLYFLMTTATTLRTKVRRFRYSWNLLSLSIVLAIFTFHSAWGIIFLSGLSAIPLYMELINRDRPARVFVIYQVLSLICLSTGWGIVEYERINSSSHSTLAMSLLLVGIFIRCGIFPFHFWVTDMFEHATFGSSLLFMAPMTGAYIVIRLLFPIAPLWSLQVLGGMAIFTCVYTAAMSMVQIEARRFFAYMTLSHASLMLVGIETISPLGMTGALCVWISMGLALMALGLVIRSLEARTGRLSLVYYHGLYEHAPELAGLFLVTGLASVGFPGTFGYIGMELLVDGAISGYSYIGYAVIVATAINGINIIQVYFRLFTGARHYTSIHLGVRKVESIAILTFILLIVGGGILPQPGIQSRYEAAMKIIESRGIKPETHDSSENVMQKSHEHDAGNKSSNANPVNTEHHNNAEVL